jgi:hypothetical protein
MCQFARCSSQTSCQLRLADDMMDTYLPDMTPAYTPAPGLAVSLCAPSRIRDGDLTQVRATVRNLGAAGVRGLTLHLLTGSANLVIKSGPKQLSGIEIPPGGGEALTWTVQGVGAAQPGLAVVVVDAQGGTVMDQRLVTVSMTDPTVLPACQTSPASGDGHCTGTESCSSQPSDCGSCAVCTDTFCSATAESCTSCAADCATCRPYCGDGTCDPLAEDANNCPADCAPSCKAMYSACSSSAECCSGLSCVRLSGKGAVYECR